MAGRIILDKKLIEIRDDLLRLASMVDQAIARSAYALVDRDMALAQQINASDDAINRLRFTIEESCYNLLATQQPNSTDLRIVVGTVSVATNLERIGDHAAGVARLVLRIADAPALSPLVALPQMAEISRWMVGQAVKAFDERTILLAEQVIERDDQVDLLNRKVYDDLITLMMATPAVIERATLLLWVAHNYERIGDRATNICERAIYVTTGELKEI
ncbi:MAG TPA: phosphate signaling complex protein PhoU [Aggregatilineales bacterium]|nr:phosphate signaling complex protein PhoU [Anaerolineales bacterium]HRE48488.1 phosphate signaling complex protein PhoU [Aggregatilineales bacterium]